MDAGPVRIGGSRLCPVSAGSKHAAVKPPFATRLSDSGMIRIHLRSFAPGAPLHANKLIAAVLLMLTNTDGMTQERPYQDVEKLGEVHFATSCNEVAQRTFNRAVARLHSFQFSRAIEGFKEVVREDSTCAIAYWGIALSDWGNPFAPGIIDVRDRKSVV